MCVGARLRRDFTAKIAEIQSDLSRESLIFLRKKKSKFPFQNVLNISLEKGCLLLPFV